MNIQETICTGNRRYKAAEPLNPQGVVLHSIGTPQPDAAVLQRFWQNDGSAYVVHYMLDDLKILHCMPDYFKCWHVGSPGNNKYLGIEMGEPRQLRYTGGDTFTVSNLAGAQDYARACYRNAVQLIAHLCRKYGWDPNKAVWTHYELTRQGLSNTDHTDPQHLWNGLGLGYDLATLRRDVAAEMGKAPQPAPQPEPAPAPTPAPSGGELYRIRKSWADAASQIGAYKNLDYAIAACPAGYAVYDSTGKQVHPPEARLVRVTASALNVRRAPSTSAAIAQVLPQGGAYTIVDEQGGWGLLKAYAANRDGWISLAYTEEV